MSKEATEKHLEQLMKISWRVVLQKHFHKSMKTPSTVSAGVARPAVRENRVAYAASKVSDGYQKNGV